MKTRLEQILKKVTLSKAIDMKHLIWETTIDDNTRAKIIEEGYSIDKDYKNELHIISW